jgi:exosortase/archaeosortase family protein
MKDEVNSLVSIFSRYIIILILGLGNLYIFYKLLTPLTMKSLAFLLSFFQGVIIKDTFIHFSYYTVSIVPACVAGAAFYLMFILIFSVPKMKVSKRISILIVSFVFLFILNVLRIFFLILVIGKPFFNTLHWILWNLVSTIFVVGIWIFIVKIYKIKSIPVYSDFIYILQLFKNSNKTKN